MKKRVILLVLCVAVLLVLAGCSAPETTTTPTAEETEPEYYYQTVDNFFEVASEGREPSENFLCDSNYIKELSVPTVEAVADIPSSITLEGVNYELTATPIDVSGRDLYYGVKNHEGYREDTTPYVVFDAITGKMNGTFHVLFRSLTTEEQNMEWEALAKSLIATYLPHIDLTDYVVLDNSDPETTKDYDFPHVFSMQAQVDGYLTDRYIYVGVDDNTIVNLVSINTNNYQGLNRSELAKIDFDEHKRVMDSYVEYVTSGKKIEEPEIKDKWIFWNADGEYLVQYRIKICLQGESFSSETIKLAFVIESTTE